MSLHLADRPRWQERATCRSMGPDVFFFELADPRITAAKVERARAICAECPVKAECLEYALTEERHRVGGIWGGTTEPERRRIRSERARQRRQAS